MAGATETWIEHEDSPIAKTVEGQKVTIRVEIPATERKRATKVTVDTEKVEGGTNLIVRSPTVFYRAYLDGGEGASDGITTPDSKLAMGEGRDKIIFVPAQQ